MLYHTIWTPTVLFGGMHFNDQFWDLTLRRKTGTVYIDQNLFTFKRLKDS